MYLDGISIHGFKSFAKKTQINFNNGITAVVGPNGCGKSNIVDAIRWVLGEQKAGSIRSEKMENVIFNGTQNIKPLGMAEVSLKIHNTKNVLPIEYSEVLITRRLFRSTESQYLLNNSPCRLKDIQDLFMDTGMGVNAYSIIELSMIETILNGKPEERRKIIEEAAGVTKYKLRRKAAFRKLEATAADLVRVNDIISEVEKNVSSLQRQVRKARRYQEFSELLKEDEIKLATHNYSKILFELDPLTEKLKETQNSRVELSTVFDEKESEIEEGRRQLLDLEKRLSAEQKALNSFALKIQKQEEQILVARERRKALETAKERLKRDKGELHERVDRNKSQLLASKEEVQQLFAKIQLAENDYQEKNSALKKIELRFQEKNDSLKSLENQRLQAVEGLTDSKKEEERIKTQLENIEEREKAIDRQLEEYELLSKIRADKLEKTVDRKSEKEAVLRRKAFEKKKLLAKIETLTKQKEQIKETILQRRSEIQTLKERIELLRKFLESYEDHPEGVQHLIKEGYLNGGYKGTIAEVLSVDENYRYAIETALGDAAVSLVVENTDQALKCIDVLKSGEKGSVTFFPLDKIHVTNGANTKDINPEQTEGMVDWAYNLVQCRDDYKPLIRSLLYDYIIVKDLAVARQYADKIQDKRINLITLNGEIYSTWGPIRGGGTAKQGGIVGRKELVKKLEKKLQKSSKMIQDDESLLQTVEQNYKKAFEKGQALSSEIKSLESNVNDLDVKQAQLNFETKKDAEVIERLSQEKQAHRTNREQLHKKFRTIAPSLNDLQENKFKFEVDHKRISEELAGLEDDIREHREIEQDSRVMLVDLKGQERHLQENISKLIDYQRELIKSQERITQEIEFTSREYVELENQIEINKKNIQVDFEQHQVLESKVHDLEQTYFKQKEILEEKEKKVKKIREERDMVSESFHGIELRVSELKHNSEKIKEMIEEEHDVGISRQQIDENLDELALTANIESLKNKLNSMGPVNLLALKEYDKEKSRFEFLQTQKNDLIEAEKNLNETIHVINRTARDRFESVFEQIRKNFIQVFTGFFENGQADLKLGPGADPLESDIIIEADPKGRKIAAISLLSGGEKTLTAISLLFGIYLVKPSPFCILDEVDAPLDDANIQRYVKAIRKFSENTQFIVVTHNKLTMREADCLYGITMQEEGVSKVVSVNFHEMELN